MEEMVMTTTGNTPEYPLDRFQRAAAEDGEAATILVVGEHGTGQTQTLVARAAYLLRRGVIPAHITALATTDGHAAHLRRRMAAHPVVGEYIGEIFIGGIDEFFNAILRDGGARVLDLSPLYTLWDEATTLRMVQLAWRAAGRKDLRISELRQVRQWRRRNLAGWPESQPSPPEKGHWREVNDIYEVELLRQGAVEGYQLPALAYSALDRDPALREKWSSGRAQHLLVEDGEGLTSRQTAGLDRLRGQRRSLMITARPRSPDDLGTGRGPMDLLLLPSSKVQVHRLKVDHGHADPIFQVYTQLRRSPSYEPPAVDETCDSPEGRPPRLVEVEGHHDDIALRCAREIARMLNGGVPWEEIAVLDRDGRAMSRVRTHLTYLGIPYRELGRSPADLPTDTRCAVALMTLLLNPDDLPSLCIAAAASHPNKDRVLSGSTALKLYRAARESGKDLVITTAELLYAGVLDPLERGLLGELIISLKVLVQIFSDPEVDLNVLYQAALATVRRSHPKGVLPLEEPHESDFADLCSRTPPLPGEGKAVHLRRILDLWSGVLHPSRAHETGTGVTFASYEEARGRSWSFVLMPDVSDQASPGKAGPYGRVLDDELLLFRDAVARGTQVLVMYYLADAGMAGQRYTLSRFLDPVRDLLEFRRQPYEPPPSYEDPFSGHDPSSAPA